MNETRRKRLVKIHIPGEVTYDDDGFPVQEQEILKKVYCKITKAKPNEIITYGLDKITEILRVTCPWGAVRGLDSREVYLTIDGNKYELFGTFINVEMANKDAYFEAKRVI